MGPGGMRPTRRRIRRLTGLGQTASDLLTQGPSAMPANTPASLWDTITGWFTTAGVYNPPPAPPPASALPGITWQNLTTGTLSPDQQAQLVQQQAAALVQASGGTMTPADAAEQAQQDVTGALVAAGAAPAGSPDLAIWLLWGGIGVIGLLALRGLTH